MIETAEMAEQTEIKQDTKQIYVVISQTGTWLSRLLRLITGKAFNHASLCLQSDLCLMYSFGRRNAYNPVWAGFVQESPHFGTFKRFRDTVVNVISIQVTAEAYAGMEQLLEQMFADRKKYRYNMIGLLLAALHIHYHPKNQYYCSEFVREVLLKFGVAGAETLKPIVHPVDFLDFPGSEVVYRGKLCNASIGTT